MTHILFDARVAGTDGIGRYTRCLLQQLRRRPELRVTTLEPTGSARYGRGDGEELLEAAERCGADLIHVPDFRMPLSGAPCPVVVTGHDILRLIEPDLCYSDADFSSRFGPALLAEITELIPEMQAVIAPPGRRPAQSAHEQYYALMLGVTVDRAAAIITPTRVVRGQITTWIAQPSGLVTVSPYGVDHGADQSTEPPADAVPPGPYLLYVGQARAHKGVDRVLAAFAGSAARRAGVLLLLAGRDFSAGGAGMDLVETADLDGAAVAVGEVSDEELTGLYRGAAAVVHATSHEGYGLTPLEALAAGTRVIASDIPVLRETLGPHATFIDRDDLTAIAKAMDNAASSMDGQDARQARRAWAAQFTWQSHASAVADTYAQVLHAA